MLTFGLRPGLRLLEWYLPERWVLLDEVDLVADDHDDNVWLGVVAQVLEPLGAVLEGLRLGHVIHQQRTHRTPVVRTRYRTVTLLTS